VPVLIASWLEAEEAQRMAAAEPDRIVLYYEPELLPTTRYVADHHGPPRNLSEHQRRRWRQLLALAEISFEFDWEAPEMLVERCPRLRWVQSTSSGIGPLVRRLRLEQSDIRVTNAAGIHAQPLAEFVLMAALYFAKQVPTLTRWKKERHWERYCGEELAGKRMALVGLGRVGRRIAELSCALGLEVIGHRRTTQGVIPSGVRQVVGLEDLEALLPTVDFLVIAAPETDETIGIIDSHRLGLLPETAVLINVGRGSLVDEPKLIEMLQAGRLRGACLDVFAQEPLPADSPLWAMPNVIVSPHSASTVEQENGRLVDLFIENIGRYLEGAPLLNQFDYVRGY
jgi:phosphoglycerate dehydrogenase-like enzyme